MPTRAGLVFALTLLVLLVASINYQLNLGYVLTFLLAGSGAVSMHMTHGTLRGLTLHLKPVGAGVRRRRRGARGRADQARPRRASASACESRRRAAGTPLRLDRRAGAAARPPRT